MTVTVLVLSWHFPTSRETTQFLRRVAKDSDEALAHPVGICEANRLRYRIERFAPVFNSWAGTFHAQALYCFRRRQSG